MEIYCTRPGCPNPRNFFADIDDEATLKVAKQKYCTSCGMPLILAERYIPSKLLGQGGFGTAFLARDRYTPTMRQCVVKQFQPSGNLNPKQLKIAQDLFEREAAVLEALGSHHPQIPQLFAFFPLSIPSLQPGKKDKFFYLTQEFIDGQNLEEEVKSQGKFSEKQALEVLLEILKILKFVHENGSIHRDIKPSNIMRERDGRLYLLDFGAVKQVKNVAVTGSPQGRSTGIYSMGFAPPEQMAGSQVYPSTDLYALAVTVITLLTGKEPEELYDSYTNQWTWRNYTQVNDTLEGILNRMLLSSPNQRFQSAQAVIEVLTTGKAPPPKPQPASPPTQIPPSPQSHNPPAATTPTPTATPRTRRRLRRSQIPSMTTTPNPTATPATPQQAMPSPLQPQNPSPPPVPRQSSFSLLEVLSGAAFTGFEGALLFIAAASLLPSPGISIGLWGMIMGGLIFAQLRRLIEKIDLLIIAGITLAVVLFIPALRELPSVDVAVIAILAGAGAIAVTALFRLVYHLLSRLL
ncbi:protein kinase domain-containing protein [Lyngbya aestuarii]|uniref:protein kinase domain-containing protein n=1 Tax=Lyngbya aestuarii TaxID=118322 RepID=UPI00403D5F4B